MVNLRPKNLKNRTRTPPLVKNAVVISASSDIGTALCRRWASKGIRVFGTYRVRSASVDALLRDGAKLVRCDLTDRDSIQAACASLSRLCPQWDTLALCPGRLDPIGPFADCDFGEWEASICVNFTAQLRMIRNLLPLRRSLAGAEPTVLCFAGGGTNDAPVNFSAYVVSKIALIKMCELLDAELPDTRFIVLGPGWVKTKIHDATLKAGRRAGRAYARTLEKLRDASGFVPMDRVLDCCDWLIRAPRQAVGGRNFSAAHDDWGGEDLLRRLSKDPSLYRLRRRGNDAAVPAR